MKRGTLKSAINRSNIEGGILAALTDSKKPLSTAEIASKLSRSWHTVIRYCLDLQNQGKIFKFEIGRISAWQVKK